MKELTQLPLSPEIVMKQNQAIEVPPTFDITRFVEEFLKSLDLKVTSKVTYKRAIRPFVAWIQEKELQRAPTREDILLYKQHLVGLRLSAMTISTYIVAVRRYFEWLESKQIYPNIARNVKGLKRSKGFRKDPLTLLQVKTLLENFPRNTLEQKRNFAVINLLIRTGLRTIEIVRADIGDIRQESGESVLWIQGKGRDVKDEFVLLTEDAKFPIDEYLRTRPAKERKDDDPLFTSISDRNSGHRLTTRTISRIVKDCFLKNGIISNRITAHSLRHTAITLALQAGATIQEAQALGRHANVNTTMIYAHNLNRIAHAPEKRIDTLLRPKKKS
ncbi:MAG: tyrosine-type recombinase/integrase [Caldisericia bacterium]|nr:tyrosine-type recombinase/integrase [Caldisericia bacterium]